MKQNSRKAKAAPGKSALRFAKLLNDQAEIKAALKEAHAAARHAFNRFKKVAKVTKEGHIVDSCGGASVMVYKPSYRLRSTLQALGQIKRDHKGYWCVSDFNTCVAQIGTSACEVACEAARIVFERHFPDENFTVRTRVD